MLVWLPEDRWTTVLAFVLGLPFGAIPYFCIWHYFPYMHLTVVLSPFFPALVGAFFAAVFLLMIERLREAHAPQAELFSGRVRLRDSRGRVVTVTPEQIERIEFRPPKSIMLDLASGTGTGRDSIEIPVTRILAEDEFEKLRNYMEGFNLATVCSLPDDSEERKLSSQPWPWNLRVPWLIGFGLLAVLAILTRSSGRSPLAIRYPPTTLRTFADPQLSWGEPPRIAGIPYGTHMSMSDRDLLGRCRIFNPDYTPNNEKSTQLGWTLRPATPDETRTAQDLERT